MQNFLLWWFVCAGVSLALYLPFVMSRRKAIRGKRPAFSDADILYQEWTASGNSQANLSTRLGGARNGLRLVVTSDYLIITSWFPFSLFTAFYDLEHVIPMAALSPVSEKRGWAGR